MPPLVWRRGLSTGLSLLGDSLLYAVLPSRPEAAGLGLAQVGLALSANRWIRMLTNPLAGRIVDRFGATWPFLAALVLAAATTAIYGSGGGVYLMLAARCGWGLAWSFIRIGGLDGVLHEGRPDDRGRLMGWLQALSRAGSLLSVATGGWLVDTIGYGATCLWFGALTLLAVPLAAPRATTPATGASGAAGGGAPAGAAAALTPAIGSPATRVGTREGLAVYAGIFATGFVVSGVITGLLGQVVRSMVDAPGAGGVAFGAATLTGWLIALRWALDLALAPRLGGLADRLGRPRVAGACLLAAIPAVAGMVGSHAALIAGWMSAPAALAALAVCSLFAFAASTTLFTVFDAAAGDLAERGRRGRILGNYSNSLDVGAAAGPLIGFWLADRAGLPAAFLVGVLTWAAAVWFYVDTARRAGQPAAAAARSA